MPAPPQQLIVRRVVVTAGDRHHGGAWKVAYADFVTAMMAFFLLLWLLGATDENKRKGLADYFTPTLVKTREQSAGSNGLLGGSSRIDADAHPYAARQTGTRALTVPMNARGGPGEGGNDAERAARRTAMAAAIRARLATRLQARPDLRGLLKQVRVVATPEGVRIDLVDDADFSMFTLGTARMVPRAEALTRELAEVVRGGTAPMVVRGHTDALPWRTNAGANNWTLSAGRAEATRAALVRGGVAGARFRRIEGVAATEPLVPAAPADPRNRRMSVLLLD
ncbi:flagellar motor protein [Erythrobacteraceae bacterium CFH 75059]|nr:flagellar motor protein [Erythrobacteraceae bacterium CFH 75059]